MRTKKVFTILNMSDGGYETPPTPGAEPDVGDPGVSEVVRKRTRVQRQPAVVRPELKYYDTYGPAISVGSNQTTNVFCLNLIPRGFANDKRVGKKVRMVSVTLKVLMNPVPVSSSSNAWWDGVRFTLGVVWLKGQQPTGSSQLLLGDILDNSVSGSWCIAPNNVNNESRIRTLRKVQGVFAGPLPDPVNANETVTDVLPPAAGGAWPGGSVRSVWKSTINPTSAQGQQLFEMYIPLKNRVTTFTPTSTSTSNSDMVDGSIWFYVVADVTHNPPFFYGATCNFFSRVRFEDD